MMLNLFGALAYATVAMLAGGACLRLRSGGWAAIAVFFVALAGWRLIGAEAQVQGWARAALRAQGAYAARATWQAPLSAAILLAGAAGGLALGRLRGAGDAALRLAGLASLALGMLSVLRALSLHAEDVLLYAGIGPLRLHHGLDMGLAAFTALCAWRAAGRATRPDGRSLFP